LRWWYLKFIEEEKEKKLGLKRLRRTIAFKQNKRMGNLIAAS